jgi:acetolactate synthase regulatory subunit
MAGHVKVSLSLRPDTLKRVRALAELHGVKVSTMADELMLDALESAELTAEATRNPVVMAAVTRAMSEPGVLRSLLDAMKADLTDEQLNLFAGPAVKLPASVLKRETRKPAKKRGRK